MADNSIPKQVLQQLKQIGVETVEKAVEETGNIGHDVITGKQLLGLEPMNAGEYDQKKIADEKDKNEEINKLQQQVGPGRNVEEEIEQIKRGKEQKEKDEEQAMLDSVRRQREAEEEERTQMAQAPGNTKREAAKHQMQPHGKKTSQPDPSQMSQTAEFKGKID